MKTAQAFIVTVAAMAAMSSAVFAQTTKAAAEKLPVYPTPDMTIDYHTDWTKGHYPQKIAEFKAKPLATNDIVLIGDSITEKGDDWGKRFGSARVRNRGIAGDVTAGVLQRLGEIYEYRAAAVFIMIGVNDINASGKSDKFVVENINRIVSDIRKNSPKTKIYVQSLLPTSKEDVSKTLRSVNSALRMNAQENGYIFINLYNDFADDNKTLRKEFTYDGIHLNEAGYAKWVENVKSTVDELLK